VWVEGVREDERPLGTVGLGDGRHGADTVGFRIAVGGWASAGGNFQVGDSVANRNSMLLTGTCKTRRKNEEISAWLATELRPRVLIAVSGGETTMHWQLHFAGTRSVANFKRARFDLFQ